MSTEIPIWVNGKIRWLSGIDKKTTCKDIVEVLLDGEGLNKLEAKDFTIMERWRKVERQLNENSKILKIWSHWGNEKKEVRLCLRRIDNEVDSGRGSPDGSGYMPSLRRKRNRIRGNGKPPWAYRETLHPRRLAELGRFGDYSQIKNRQNEAVNDCEPLNDTNFKDKICEAKDIDIKTRDTETVNSRKSSGHRSYHCSGTGRLHSTPCSENHSKRTKCCSKREFKQKVRNSENIERLMKLILAQGATIQSQLQKLKEREEQIELLEQERHRERIQKNGRNYLLETYLGSLKDAEIPDGLNNSEGENETEEQKTETDRPNSNEVVVCLNKDRKICEKEQLGRKDNSGLQFKPRHKNTRSRSESRTQESKLEGNLKRAFSDNAIAETNCANVDCSTREVSPQFVMQNTKEEYEDVVELKRIQSQIEMWEKVFKINKKLEKEEENLVRLHIKIKKIQSENYRIAKDKTETIEKENKKATISEELLSEINDSKKIRYKQDCAELEKNLECVKSDLENNSKEIYKNFTRLMEKDEKVAHKHNHLLKIMADLERTNQEHDMLNEMITMKENQQFENNQISSFDKSTSDFGGKNTIQNLDEGLPIENKVKMKEANCAGTENSAVENVYSKSLDLPRIQEYVNQRTETNVADQEVLLPTKPKIVKISFENKLKNYETSGNSEEKMLYKDPMPVPVGALKSILKNRRNGLNKINNLNNEFQHQQEISHNYEPKNEGVLVPKNLGVNDSYIQNYHPQIADVPNRINSNYPRTTQYPLYVNFPNENCQVFNGQLSELSENFKGINILKNHKITITHPQEISKIPFQNSTIVTTKALIHNDTDSSTSSDTSGLSSMYSSSTTVEEPPYVEKSYVLDTLV